MSKNTEKYWWKTVSEIRFDCLKFEDLVFYENKDMHEDGSRTNQEIVSLKLPLGEGVKGGGMGVKVSEGVWV